MKRAEKKSFIIMITIIIFAIINALFFNTLKYVNSSYVITWIIILGVTVAFLGYMKDRNIYKVDLIQIIIIFTVTYLILTYLSGLFMGFSRNPYNTSSLIKILKNIVPVIIVIVLQEIFRYVVIKKTINNKKGYCLLVLLFVILEISISFKAYNLTDALDLFTYIGTILLPSIMINIMLTYLSSKGGYLPCIAYRIITELYVFVLPISPDLGVYFKSVLGVIFPCILFIRINTLFAKKKEDDRYTKKFVNALINIPLVACLAFIVILASNKFEYRALAIASNSMYPVFKRGDAVVLKTVDTEEELDALDIGDIIVFKKESKIVVHRIVGVDDSGGDFTFTTKGDNNDVEDTGSLPSKDIIGIVKFIVPYIGYPSVYLTEKVN